MRRGNIGVLIFDSPAENLTEQRVVFCKDSQNLNSKSEKDNADYDIDVVSCSNAAGENKGNTNQH